MNGYSPSPNFDLRRGAFAPDMIVLHYTDMDRADAAVAWLCNPASRVSAHYLITEAGGIVQMVAEEARAWHAGISAWAPDAGVDVNSRSIGIELANPGHRPKAPSFPEAQIGALLRLMDGIRRRWPIPARNVVAHSDIAPGRKIDPGERFPWRTLHAAGHALFVEPRRSGSTFSRDAVLDALERSGYVAHRCDLARLVTAFHRRHLPERTGRAADLVTLGTALALAQAVAADRMAVL